MPSKKVRKLIEAIKGESSYETLSQNLKNYGVNISVSSLKKYVSGNDNRFPSYETLEGLRNYANKIGVEAPGIGEIISDLHDDGVGYLRRTVNVKKSTDFKLETVNIPIIGDVPAGKPVFSEENFEGVMPMPLAFAHDPKNFFILKITGDSMTDMDIEDGDLVIVHHQKTAENGQTVIARIDGEVTCKRFYLTKDKIKLEPANIKYKAIESKEVEIVGVVTRIIKKVD